MKNIIDVDSEGEYETDESSDGQIEHSQSISQN